MLIMLAHLKVLISEHHFIFHLVLVDDFKKIRCVVDTLLGDFLLILKSHGIFFRERTVSISVTADFRTIDPVVRSVVRFHIHLLVVKEVIFHGPEKV